MYNIKKIVVGFNYENCYILEDNNKCIIIDPGSNPEKIDSYIEYEPLAILLTHGHFDHVNAVDKLVDKYNCKVYMNHEDIMLINYKDKYKNKRGSVRHNIIDLKDGPLNISNFNFEIYETSGHTLGSVIIRYENVLFTGDTLFNYSIGRCDLEGGSDSKMKQSLKFIKTLDPNFIIYPGHGDSSTLDFEFKNNPFL